MDIVGAYLVATKFYGWYFYAFDIYVMNFIYKKLYSKYINKNSPFSHN